MLAETGPDVIGAYLLLMALSLALIALFLAVGTLISVVCSERVKALGLSLCVWFVSVILYDLVVFGRTVSGPGISLRALLLLALMGNPVDAVRVAYLLLTGNNGFVGVTGAVLSESLGSPGGLALLGVILGTWTVGPLYLGSVLFGRRDH